MRISWNLHPIATKRNTFNYDMEIGLYIVDGLAVLVHPPPTPPPPPKIERIKKEICKVFAKNNLRVTMEINTKA